MKTIYTPLVVLLIAGVQLTEGHCQGIGFPEIDVLEEGAKQRGELSVGVGPDDIVYSSDDFNQPEKGKLMKADIKGMRAILLKTKQLISEVPDGPEGRSSILFEQIEKFNNSINAALMQDSEYSLILLGGDLLAIDESTSNKELARELRDVKGNTTQLGFYIIRAIASRLRNNDVFSDQVFRDTIAVFTNNRIADETAWDVDDPMPVDSAGIFILNPGLAVEELKKRPVKRVRYFLANITEPAEFFERYVGEGDGLEVLKAQYAANRAVIDAKHREVVAWLAAQPME